MSGVLGDEYPQSLPDSLPIFPLADTLLLPRCQLPLHIFEPKYVAMVDFALASDRLIGMIQPQEPPVPSADANPSPALAPPALYAVGCAGRIVRFTETEDHRYFITLQGIIRFRVRDERPARHGFREVHPDWSRFHGDLRRDDDNALDHKREALQQALKGYLDSNNLLGEWKTLDKISIPQLVNAVAMLCPFAAEEKQALLEADDIQQRCEILLAVIQLTAPASSKRTN